MAKFIITTTLIILLIVSAIEVRKLPRESIDDYQTLSTYKGY